MKIFKTYHQPLSFLALALGLAAAISCAGAPKPVERSPDPALYEGLGLPGDPQPFMEDIRTGTLPSGLRYYILENAMPEGRAYLALAVNAGSVLETDEERGLAHFVEHMAFNGTERFPKFELVEYLRSLGMRFGPEVNAYTSYNETVYTIEVPVEFDPDGSKVIPGTALEVLDDWTRAISFNAEAVNSERAVILEEARYRSGAVERLGQQLLPLLYRGSPYVDRLPIGLPEIIETAPVERLVNFYKTWYRADTMALILVGDFDGAKLEASLAERFSIAAPETPLERPYYELPEPKKGSLAAEIHTDPELPYAQVYLFYKLPLENSAGDLAAYRDELIEKLVNTMLEERLNEASYDQTPFTFAGAGKSLYTKRSGYFMLVGIAKPGRAEATLDRLLLEKEKVVRHGFTASEIAQAKRSLLADMEQMVSEKDRQHSSNYLSGLVEHFINQQAVPGIEWSRQAMAQLLPGIGAEEIAEAARGCFASNDLTVFIGGPEAEAASLPSQNRVKALVRRNSRVRIPRPAEQEMDDQLLDQPPVPGDIVTESADAGSGTIRWELGNGAVVILKETKNKNNEIVLCALAKGGVTAVPEEQIFSADTAAEMLGLSGIGPYSQPDLSKKLAGKQASIGFSLSGFTRNFQGHSTQGDIRTLFELLYLRFTQPRIDDVAVANLLDDYRTELAQHDQNPEAFFSDEINRTLYSNNPYFTPMVLADLEKINAADALAIIKKALNPADYVFVFTGNVDAEELRPLVETYLASIPRSAESWNVWADIVVTRPGKMEKTIYKGKSDKSLVFMAWVAPQQYSEEHEAAAAVLSEYLENRLTDKIRQQMGGTYSIAAGVIQSIFLGGGELNMSVYFPCAPGRVKELTAAIQEEIDSVARGVIDQDAFNKSVEALKKNFEVSMQENLYIGRNYAMFSMLHDRPLSRLEQRPALFQAVSKNDIQRIVQKLLPQGPVTIILYPEDTKEGVKND